MGLVVICGALYDFLETPAKLFDYLLLGQLLSLAVGLGAVRYCQQTLASRLDYIFSYQTKCVSEK